MTFAFSKLFSQDAPPENPWESGSSRPQPSAPRFQNTGNRRYSGGGNGGGVPPQDLFKQFFNNPQSPIKPFILVGVAAVALWLASGIYRVLPEENAVILRFGEYTQTVTEPGLHYHLPAPFEIALKPNVTFERRLELGFRGPAFEGGQKQDVTEESMMLTGDANIVDLDFVVQWKVGDARQFLFNIREPEATLKRVAESAMREVVGQNNLQDIITDGREDIAVRVKTIMQQILNSYNAGIMVTQVLIQDSTVPQPVLDAFEEVIRAQQQAETLRNQALKYRNEIVPRAQGDAIRLIKEAEGYQGRVVAQAKGDAQRFIDVYNAYASAKDVTRERLYIEAWEDILQNSDALILDGQKNGALPYLNLNDLKKRKTTSVTDSLSEDK